MNLVYLAVCGINHTVTIPAANFVYKNDNYYVFILIGIAYEDMRAFRPGSPKAGAPIRRFEGEVMLRMNACRYRQAPWRSPGRPWQPVLAQYRLQCHCSHGPAPILGARLAMGETTTPPILINSFRHTCESRHTCERLRPRHARDFPAGAGGTQPARG